ncbi:AAA family ATPase [Mycolicibacter virginiensis]|uniref:AAA family ATPase n=1 Tax=Mycolicibacter virginiensis TaxID=1795032 RepID=UPI001F04B832|nr:AAA family ATPase [Mycolicibacter virginiensis]ULP45945.1 helicase RepA family protein [Mycolicibacter virginiensis]
MTAPETQEADSLLAEVITAAELHHQEFAELVQFVHGLITEGFGIVAGPPKLGKSWWTLCVALAIAAGGSAFGKVSVEQRDVLLLALEDSPRRLQGRIQAVWGDGIPPHRLHILTKVGPRLLIPTISAWLVSHPRGLVILDTLGRARQQRNRGDDAYLADYQAGVSLKNIVDAFPGSALLGVHHTRKASSDDFVDDLSGTLGLAGAADYVLVLRRQRNSTEATLQVTGRDAPEGEYAFTVTEGMWRLAGNELSEAAAEAQKRRDSKRYGERAMEVVAVVNRRAPANHTTAADVAEALGLDNDQARVYLNRLAKADRISKVGVGAYTSVTTVTTVTPPANCGNEGGESAAGVTPSNTTATVTPPEPRRASENGQSVTLVTGETDTQNQPSGAKGNVHD